MQSGAIASLLGKDFFSILGGCSGERERGGGFESFLSREREEGFRERERDMRVVGVFSRGGEGDLSRGREGDLRESEGDKWAWGVCS